MSKVRMKSLANTIPDYTENSLRRMINGLDQLSNKVVAENEKAILDSINVLVRDSGILIVKKTLIMYGKY